MAAVRGMYHGVVPGCGIEGVDKVIFLWEDLALEAGSLPNEISRIGIEAHRRRRRVLRH